MKQKTVSSFSTGFEVALSYTFHFSIKMPRGMHLSDETRRLITGFREKGRKISEITARFNRHRNTVMHFLKYLDDYGIIKRSGRK